MSFDIYLDEKECVHCHRGGGPTWQRNLTHNVNRIVDLCLLAGGATVAKGEEAEKHYHDWSWGRLGGWSAEDAAPILALALIEAQKPERMEEFRKLEPPNGWGSLGAVIEVLGAFHAACLANPGTTVSTSG